MPMYNYTCPDCGANLDPGERCDCKRKKEIELPDANQTSSIMKTDVESVSECSIAQKPRIVKTKPSNKKLGNDFEREFCEILANHGFWVHNLAQNQDGQPADVIAVRNEKAHLIDCKVCSTKKGFDPSRMEENQDLAMKRWRECGNRTGVFAIRIESEIYLIYHSVITVFKEAHKTLTVEDVKVWGIPFEKWVTLCE